MREVETELGVKDKEISKLRLAQLMIDTKNTFQELQTQNLNHTVRHATMYKKGQRKAFDFEVEPEPRQEETKEQPPQQPEATTPEPELHVA